MRTYLHLEDGDRFEGDQFGYQGTSAGEVVFSTGMTGYVQSLTDPSFAGQILVFTYPLIGNYGVPKGREMAPSLMENMESTHIQVEGVVVSEYAEFPSHYALDTTFSSWLRDEKICGIAGIDTRRLTQKIREKGCMRGMISPQKTVQFKNPPSRHFVSEVSCREAIVYAPSGKPKKRIALVDCGVKHGILRTLLSMGYHVTRIPWDADPMKVPGIEGVIVSNGPGDPKECQVTIASIRRVIDAGIPYLGICLGHQLLALAIGADTYKLPYGHRGLNQPCQDLQNGKAYMTSQNHGYAVDRNTIPEDYIEWFINLNDRTNEGICHRMLNISSVQFHPEGEPGPFDSRFILGKLL
jgi:carbamoyl-phosphate synthase small subunit